jgi:hypothetical protein
MRTLTIAILSIVLLAKIVSLVDPGNTAAVVLAVGAPFALFANVMAIDAPGSFTENSPVSGVRAR